MITDGYKYIIFLQPHYFKYYIFKSIFKKIIKNLELKGIIVFNIETFIDELKNNISPPKILRTIGSKKILDISDRTKVFLFDDMPYPNTNTLYILLLNNNNHYYYYNDTIYNQKKMEIEREMLFLLAGKLGVQYISYKTEIIETTISEASAGIDAKMINTSARYKKDTIIKKGISGKETYLNRGAPVYLKSNNLFDVEKNIEERMDMMTFNYNFYKNNSKLQSFVYKRFEFKMSRLEYSIESEDISEISFAVKACFMNYGLNISFDKNISTIEKVKYTLDFFSDNELKYEFCRLNRYYLDKFFSIRELYDLDPDKEKAVQLICEYVYEIASNSHHINKLELYIRNSQNNEFEQICSTFQSTLQIKNWLNKMFGNHSITTSGSDDSPIFIEELTNNSKLNKWEKETLDELRKYDTKYTHDLLTREEPVIISQASNIDTNIKYAHDLCTSTRDDYEPLQPLESRISPV